MLVLVVVLVLVLAVVELLLLLGSELLSVDLNLVRKERGLRTKHDENR